VRPSYVYVVNLFEGTGESGRKGSSEDSCARV